MLDSRELSTRARRELDGIRYAILPHCLKGVGGTPTAEA
ncbi:hypothetical protein SNL152K_6243 [Streptomyces sp. NL15-2K]|nr:hypothetical protein SNL152K_6243 [Streptomyces sp. NL15-2K]